MPWPRMCAAGRTARRVRRGERLPCRPDRVRQDDAAAVALGPGTHGEWLGPLRSTTRFAVGAAPDHDGVSTPAAPLGIGPIQRRIWVATAGAGPKGPGGGPP